MVEKEKKQPVEPQDVVSAAKKKKLTYEEKLLKIEEKEKQLKAKRRKLIAQHSQAERKARTRRLIQLGGMAEKYLGVMDSEKDQARFAQDLMIIQLLRQKEPGDKPYTKEALQIALQIKRMIEKQLHRPLNPEDVQRLQTFLEKQDKRGNYFKDTMK
jgi:hypothetical protein